LVKPTCNKYLPVPEYVFESVLPQANLSRRVQHLLLDGSFYSDRSKTHSEGALQFRPARVVDHDLVIAKGSSDDHRRLRIADELD